MEDLLHDDDIYPSIIEYALFVIDTDGAKIVALIQAHARCIGREGCQHHFVISQAPRPCLQCAHQRVPDASSSLLPGDINGDIRDGVIDWPGVEGIEGGPAYHPFPVLRDDKHRVSGATCGKPLGPLFWCAQLCL